MQKNQQDQRQPEKHGDVQSALQVGANQADERESRRGAVRVDQGREEYGDYQAHGNKQCPIDCSPPGNCRFFVKAFSGRIHLYWKLHMSCILEGTVQRFATLIGIGRKIEKFNSQTLAPETNEQKPID